MNVTYREQVVYVFGPFRLDPLRHLLLRDGQPVSLAPRLFDTLFYLVSHAGRIVESDEIMRAVWGPRVVEQTNLKQTIFTLRKALQTGADGDRYIVTAPTRGYVFAAPVHVEARQDGEETNSAAGLAASPCGLQDLRAPVRPRRTLLMGAAALAGAALMSASLILGWPFAAGPDAAFTPPAHSLAVLALTNLSADPAQRYFSDGVSEELISTLSRIGALHVAARTSAFSFRDRAVTVNEIGRVLNVGAVLEGSVRRTGKQLRIAVALIDTRTGFTLWADSYDRDPGDMLVLQGEIASAIATSLQVKLGVGLSHLTAGGTSDPAAFDAYLRGVTAAESMSGAAGGQSALPYFDRAIAIDPRFAMARARRSSALLLIANTEVTRNLAAVHSMLADALAEAGRAIAIAPGLGLAHLARGAVLMSVQDFRTADSEMAQAHALAPGDARVVMDFALAQIQFGRIDEGIRAAEQAVALDPLVPIPYLNLANALALGKRYDDARQALQHARSLGGGKGAALVERTIALARGDYATALSLCADGQSWTDFVCLARAYHGLGRQDDAARQLARLKTMLGDNGAYQYAEIYAQWGDLPQAVQWLQTAWRLNDAGLALLKSDPMLAPIRATPDYLKIERALNFPD